MSFVPFHIIIFSLHFRNPLLPTDVQDVNISDDETESADLPPSDTSTDRSAASAAATAAALKTIVGKNLEKAQQRQKKHYDRRVTPSKVNATSS